MAFTINVNGVDRTVDAEGDTPLLWVLRDVLGRPARSSAAAWRCAAPALCMSTATPRALVSPRSTVSAPQKSLRSRQSARPRRGAKMQKAWLDREVVQCGYCQSGHIMSASALLASNPHPTDSDIDDAMSGNICRCGTYVRIREAIKEAAQSSGQRS